jgi:hypothetical protein
MRFYRSRWGVHSQEQGRTCQSGSAELWSLVQSLRRRCLSWKNSDNPCAESIRLDSQFAMDLANTLPHSPDSNASPLGPDLSKSFLRHSPPVIRNLHMNLVRFAGNTDYRGFASRMTMNVC